MLPTEAAAGPTQAICRPAGSRRGRELLPSAENLRISKFQIQQLAIATYRLSAVQHVTSKDDCWLPISEFIAKGPVSQVTPNVNVIVAALKSSFFIEVTPDNTAYRPKGKKSKQSKKGRRLLEGTVDKRRFAIFFPNRVLRHDEIFPALERLRVPVSHFRLETLSAPPAVKYSRLVVTLDPTVPIDTNPCEQAIVKTSKEAQFQPIISWKSQRDYDGNKSVEVWRKAVKEDRLKCGLPPVKNGPHKRNHWEAGLDALASAPNKRSKEMDGSSQQFSRPSTLHPLKLSGLQEGLVLRVGLGKPADADTIQTIHESQPCMFPVLVIHEGYTLHCVYLNEVDTVQVANELSSGKYSGIRDVHPLRGDEECEWWLRFLREWALVAASRSVRFWNDKSGGVRKLLADQLAANQNGKTSEGSSQTTSSDISKWRKFTKAPNSRLAVRRHPGRFVASFSGRSVKLRSLLWYLFSGLPVDSALLGQALQVLEPFSSVSMPTGVGCCETDSDSSDVLDDFSACRKGTIPLEMDMEPKKTNQSLACLEHTLKAVSITKKAYNADGGSNSSDDEPVMDKRLLKLIQNGQEVVGKTVTEPEPSEILELCEMFKVIGDVSQAETGSRRLGDLPPASKNKPVGDKGCKSQARRAASPDS